MARPSRDADRDLLVSADILGAVGVTAADIRRTAAESDDLESALAEALATPVDRTTVLRRTICRSDRGIDCAARYSQAALERELTTAFGAIGWSLSVAGTREGLALTATDPHGRGRETAVSYPETPLAGDNFPAVLWTINETVLAATDARFVLLSSGVDRWRATLVETSELERLRDRYGPRIGAFDRPLLPEFGLESYVPDADTGGGTASPLEATADGDPWPPWAVEGGARRPTAPAPAVDSLIDEAEPGLDLDTEPAATPDSESELNSQSTATGDSSDAATASPAEPSTRTATPSSEIDGYEIRGTPSVSRSREVDSDPADERDSGTAAAGSSSTADSSSRAADSRTTDGAETDEFGTLSGTSTTARVGNDSFGTDLGSPSEDDRYRALGAALDAGGNVSVRGLLEDEAFLPELPATGPAETRIEFPDRCGPVTVPETSAAAEQSGFEWVETDSLETTRVSDR
ncbi:hypothetical protein [Natrinema versiforme]|uniref:Uncharacterized protein n=1 Tax=Natrinema versiforme JCM 10478 TaxID=1227496 RepID=L9XWW4_9EURY|nr:hypothetical protein [Natrinema versiforme]ELY65921.1 hypothetical protein C489_13708 [Natrinema versiforme JCM 10478]